MSGLGNKKGLLHKDTFSDQVKNESIQYQNEQALASCSISLNTLSDARVLRLLSCSQIASSTALYGKDTNQNLHRLARRNVHNIVSANEGVSKFVLQFAVFVLFRLFQGDVHVAIEAGKNTSILGSSVEFDNNRSS